MSRSLQHLWIRTLTLLLQQAVSARQPLGSFSRSFELFHVYLILARQGKRHTKYNI